MDMAGIISPLFALVLAFAFALAFAPLAVLVIIPLRARVISVLLRATCCWLSVGRRACA